MAHSDGKPRTILVVDDDVSVRTVIGAVLRRQTFEVLETDTGEEALRLVQARGAPIDLVISDLNMPEMGGWVLLDQLRRSCPSLRVLLVSGEDQTDDALSRGANAPIAFLAKPFTPAQLSNAVKRLLEDASTTEGAA